MSTHCIGRAVCVIATAMTVLILVAGCGKSEPTATPAPSTATATPVPPTATPAPSETPLPTHTPEPDSALDGREGSVIVYCYQPVTGANTKKEIHAINADGSGDVSIINTDVGLNHHDWSPDAQKFAAVGYSSATTWSIYVFDADGSNLTRLTSASDVWDNDPAWSPDGTRIVFTRIYPDHNREEVWLMNSDGSNQHWIGVEGGSAKWSPDGTRLIYHSQKSPDDSYDIYTCKVDGTDEKQLTFTPSGEITPVYSPDGSQIALTVVGDDLSHDIHIMNSDGTNTHRLTEGGAPKWSPDGSLVAFHSGPFEEWEVYIINSDGTNLRQVTHSPAGITAINPVWQSVATVASSVEAATLGDTWARPADGMMMVYVPTGEFEMGSTNAQIEGAMSLCDQYPDEYGKCKAANFETESPQHAVTLDGFWIDRTEVTNAQYALCVTDGACQESRLASDPTYNGDDYPVAGVSWQDAMDYCAWAGGRLPTEAQWEYAARGTTGYVYPWGDEFDCQGGNFWDEGTGCDDGYPKPAPVGSFPAGISWCGALDMAGNAWEWVADVHSPYPVEAQENPTGPATGSERILRGGSWGYLPAFVRTAYRYPVPPTADYLAVGFRCAIPAGD